MQVDLKFVFLQSFADSWVDFLLKESEEREKRESAEEDSHGRSPMPGVDLPPTTAATASGVSRPKYSPSQKKRDQKKKR